MSANLQYADSMSPALEMKLKNLYNKVAMEESIPKTHNGYVGKAVGGRMLGGGDCNCDESGLMGGALQGGRLIGSGRGPSKVKKGRGHGSSKQKAAAAQSPWNKHIAELRAQNPGLKYRDALEMAKGGKTGYVKKSKN